MKHLNVSRVHYQNGIVLIFLSWLFTIHKTYIWLKNLVWVPDTLSALTRAVWILFECTRHHKYTDKEFVMFVYHVVIYYSIESINVDIMGKKKL